jgi:hypothetical protein
MSRGEPVSRIANRIFAIGLLGVAAKNAWLAFDLYREGVFQAYQSAAPMVVGTWLYLVAFFLVLPVAAWQVWRGVASGPVSAVFLCGIGIAYFGAVSVFFIHSGYPWKSAILHLLLNVAGVGFAAALALRDHRARKGS